MAGLIGLGGDRCDTSNRVHIAPEGAAAMECCGLFELWNLLTPRVLADCIHYAKFARSRPPHVSNSANREDHLIAPIDQDRVPDRLSLARSFADLEVCPAVNISVLHERRRVRLMAQDKDSLSHLADSRNIKVEAQVSEPLHVLLVLDASSAIILKQCHAESGALGPRKKSWPDERYLGQDAADHGVITELVQRLQAVDLQWLKERQQDRANAKRCPD